MRLNEELLKLEEVDEDVYVVDEVGSVILREALLLKREGNELIPINYDEAKVEKIMRLTESIDEIDRLTAELKEVLERAAAFPEESEWLRAKAECVLSKLERVVPSAKELYNELKSEGVIVTIV